MALQIYNTLTKEKTPFVPLRAGEVRMYVCGPTVYDLLHVGNLRGPIFFNLVRNWLEHSGYKVNYVYNFTDVDDRIIQRSIEEKIPPGDVAEKYIAEFKKDFASLKLSAHSHNPRVTESMPEIIAMIEKLIAKESAYVVDGEVLYSVRSFKEYGKLSHKNMEDLQPSEAAEPRDGGRKKQDPMDFALWKPAKPGEPKWPSPWSEGRPGWHIECSAMIDSLLGESIDIHGGGMDLIFPHHENEIAQSEGVSGHRFVKYWMHNNMITFGDRKMSKSLGNTMKGREFLEKYNGEILKFMMLSVHYRSQSDFSDQGVHFAVAGLARIYSSLNLAEKTLQAGAAQLMKAGAVQAKFAAALEAAKIAATEALDDDFSTPELFAHLYNIIRSFNGLVRLGQKLTPELLATAEAFQSFILAHGQILALFQEPPGAFLRLLDDMLLEQKSLKREQIDALVEARSAVRVAKDFKKSDELRDQLVTLGIALQDTPLGTTWEVSK